MKSLLTTTLLLAVTTAVAVPERSDPFYLSEELPTQHYRHHSEYAALLAVARDENGATAMIEHDGDVHHVMAGGTVGPFVIETIEDESITFRNGEQLCHLSVGATFRVVKT